MPNDKGLTWDEASPDLRSIVADNQAWAESKGYAPRGSAEHGALRMQERLGRELLDKKRPR